MSFIKKTLYLFGLGVLFSLASCQPKVIRGLEKLEAIDVPVFSAFIQPHTNNPEKYRCKIQAYGQKISGVLLVKKVDLGDRMLMMTDFGLKVVDVLFYKDGRYQINYLMKYLDYPMVRKAFALNLQMLSARVWGHDVHIYQSQDGLIVRDKGQSLIYFLDKRNEIKKVQRYGGKRKLLAVASKQEDSWIKVQQFKPAMFMKLKLMDDANK